MLKYRGATMEPGKVFRGPGEHTRQTWAGRRRPRLVYNALPLGSTGGVATYMRELLGALPLAVVADLVAVTDLDAARWLPPEVGLRRRPRLRGATRALVGGAWLGSADLVHGLDVDLPVLGGMPKVATVHDLAVYDVPDAFPGRRAFGERVLVRQSLRRADAVIAVSSFTAERVRHWFGREAVVVPEAPGSNLSPPSSEAVVELRRRYGLPERFVLHVGNRDHRKNLDQLAWACREIGIPLVATGGALFGAQLPAGVTTIGRVSNRDLPALYGAATVAGYLSRYEGFGLPPLEAMACGAAVVTSPVPAVTEWVADGARIVPTGDLTALVESLRELVEDDDQRRELAERGRVRVGMLTWAATAAQSAAVYRSLGIAC